MHKKPATYVASIRIDIKDLASIALFYNSIGEHLGTSSKLVSEVIHNSAGLLQKNFPIDDITQAVEVLNNLGYVDIMRKNARHHKALINTLSLESQQGTRHNQNIRHIQNIMTEKITIIKPKDVKDVKNAANSKQSALGHEKQLTENELKELNEKSNGELKDMRKSMEVQNA